MRLLIKDTEEGIDIEPTGDCVSDEEYSFIIALLETTADNLDGFKKWEDFDVEYGSNEFFIETEFKGENLVVKFGPTDESVTFDNIRLTVAWHVFMNMISYMDLILNDSNDANRVLH